MWDEGRRQQGRRVQGPCTTENGQKCPPWTRKVQPGREVQPWTKVHSRREKSTLDGKSPPRTRSAHPGQEVSTPDERSPQRYGSRETGPPQSPRGSSPLWTGRGEVTLELKSELLGPNANLNNSILDQATQGHNQHQEQEVLPCQRRHKRLEREVPRVSKTAQKSPAETNAGTNRSRRSSRI